MQYKPRCKAKLISEHGSNLYKKHYQAIKVEGLESREEVAEQLAYKDFESEHLQRKILELCGQDILESIMQQMPQCLAK